MDSMLRRDLDSENVHLVLRRVLMGTVKFITADLISSVSATVTLAVPLYGPYACLLTMWQRLDYYGQWGTHTSEPLSVPECHALVPS